MINVQAYDRVGKARNLRIIAEFSASSFDAVRDAFLDSLTGEPNWLYMVMWDDTIAEVVEQPVSYDSTKNLVPEHGLRIHVQPQNFGSPYTTEFDNWAEAARWLHVICSGGPKDTPMSIRIYQSTNAAPLLDQGDIIARHPESIVHPKVQPQPGDEAYVPYRRTS
jgi:hypothetical protein